MWIDSRPKIEYQKKGRLGQREQTKLRLHGRSGWPLAIYFYHSVFLWIRPADSIRDPFFFPTRRYRWCFWWLPDSTMGFITMHFHHHLGNVFVIFANHRTANLSFAPASKILQIPCEEVFGRLGLSWPFLNPPQKEHGKNILHSNCPKVLDVQSCRCVRSKLPLFDIGDVHQPIGFILKGFPISY